MSVAVTLPGQSSWFLAHVVLCTGDIQDGMRAKSKFVMASHTLHRAGPDSDISDTVPTMSPGQAGDLCTAVPLSGREDMFRVYPRFLLLLSDTQSLWLPGQAGGLGPAALPDTKADDDSDWTNDAGLNAMARDLGVLDGTETRGVRGGQVRPLASENLEQQGRSRTLARQADWVKPKGMLIIAPEHPLCLARGCCDDLVLLLHMSEGF